MVSICQVSRVLKDFCSARSSVIGFLQDSSDSSDSCSLGGQLFKGVFCRRGAKLITANLSMFHGFE